MFRVKKTQMDAFAQAMALEQLESDMLVHLPEFSPGDVEPLGKAGMLRVVRLGIERARAYGVTNPAMLRSYVELMFMFGSFFDTDPFLPWAGEVLRDPELAGQVERTRLLYEKTCWYQQSVAGPDRRVALQVLQDLSGGSVDGFSFDDPRIASEIQRAVWNIHGSRGSYLGEPRLRQLAVEATESARRHGLGAARDVVLVALMMFMLGHGFAEDPLYPWVIVTLGDAPGEDMGARSRRLNEGFQGYLEQVLSQVARRQANDPR